MRLRHGACVAVPRVPARHRSRAYPACTAIALGNISLAAIYALIYKKLDKAWLRDVFAVVLAAAVKLAVLFLLIVKILIPLLALPDKQAAMMSAMFSWPQLVTALIGGVLGTAVSIPVKKAMSGKK